MNTTRTPAFAALRRGKQNLIAAALTCALASVSTAAQAADPVATPPATSATIPAAAPALAPTTASDEAPWQFGVTVPIWAAGIDGNATVLGHQQNLNIGFNQLLDHLDATLALGFDVRKGKFDIYGDVMYMKLSGSFTGPLGGNTSADLKFVLANAGLSYQLVKAGEEHPFVLAGTAGIRYWYANTSLTFRGPLGIVNLKGGNTYNLVDPVIGLRGSQYLTRKLHLDFQGDFGGFDISHDTDITWSATGLVTYDFAKWFSVGAGYQAVALDVANGSGASKNGVNLIFNGVLITLKVKF